MKSIVEFSVKYPITILMVVLAILLMGTISFEKLGMDLFPELKNPRLYIELRAGELPPEEIEKQFVQSIESQAIREKNAVNVSSISRVGAAQLTIEYSWRTNMNEAYLSLQKALASTQQNAAIDELNITQYDPNAEPIVILGFSHPEITDMNELRKVAESYIRNELIRLEGIADIRLMGQEEKEVVIETNRYILDAFGLTPSGLASSITQYNRNVSGGSITEMGTKYTIRGISEFGSIHDIENVIVAYKQPTATTSAGNTERVPVYLKDVASISYKNKTPYNIVRINQKQCMALAIYKETKYNTVNAVNDLMKALENIRARLPEYQLTVIQNKGKFISTAISEVQQTLLYGIFLAVVVLYIFLRRIGTTMIISLSMPISIIATFNFMYFDGLTLNIMTLGGLALGAGMLVDNSIVVMESIFRNFEDGAPLREAIIRGTYQVGGAITSSTVTTVVVFLPIVYLHGSEGALFKDQAWTVTFSLMSSLGVALTVIPVLSKWLLKEKDTGSSQVKSLRFSWYGNFLRSTLRFRWIVVIVTAAIIAVTIYLLRFVGSEFIPKTDTNEFTVDLRLPEGTELYRTEGTVAGIEKQISAVLDNDIESMFSVTGPTTAISISTGSIFESENTAVLKLVLKKERTRSTETVLSAISDVLSQIPDIEANVFQEQTALELTIGSHTSPMVIEIRGSDLTTIRDLTEKVKALAENVEGLQNIETNFDEGRPEINISLDPFQSAVYNVSVQNLISQLQSLLMGTNAGQLDAESELLDITILLPKISVGGLEDVNLTSGSNIISLNTVANINKARSPNAISRNNQVRTGEVTALLHKNVPLDRMVQTINGVMKKVALPPNYEYEITGEEQKRQESFKSLRFALLLSLALVYMVLAAQFESLLHPFTVILSIPMAFVGAIAIFLIMGKTMNIMAYIGIIMLGGIAVNDAIILVDRINQLKSDGLTLIDAVVMAGQQRIRPILMTSLTTILGLLPLTIGFGEGVSLRAPMALAVMGGLTTSTALTLIVIPCVYYIIDVLHQRIFKRTITV